MKKSFRYLLFALLLFPQTALAHPGHMTADFMGGIFHPFSGLDHILAMVAVGLWATQLRGRSLWALPLTFVGVMILGGLAGRMGLQLPFVEPIIAASFLILGLLITLGVRAPLAVGSTIVGFFAAFHGYAHIAEMGSHSLITYILGFSLATALLHAMGIGLGLMGDRLHSRLVQVSGLVTLSLGLALLFV